MRDPTEDGTPANSVRRQRDIEAAVRRFVFLEWCDREGFAAASPLIESGGVGTRRGDHSLAIPASGNNSDLTEK
jgi:hypothetical protein